jgi:hypothetical protein
VQHIGGDAGRQQMAHRRRGDERRLLGRLGDRGIAGGERGGDLPGEDRQRKIPRRDAGEDPTAIEPDFVAFAGRARQGLRHGEFGAGMCRVIA